MTRRPVEEFYAELEALGEDTVRDRLATKVYGDAGHKRELVEEWLRRQRQEHDDAVTREQTEIARDAAASARAAAAAARDAANEARTANRIAKIAIVIAIISAIIALLAQLNVPPSPSAP